MTEPRDQNQNDNSTNENPETDQDIVSPDMFQQLYGSEDPTTKEMPDDVQRLIEERRRRLRDD